MDNPIIKHPTMEELCFGFVANTFARNVKPNCNGAKGAYTITSSSSKNENTKFENIDLIVNRISDIYWCNCNINNIKNSNSNMMVECDLTRNENIAGESIVQEIHRKNSTSKGYPPRTVKQRQEQQIQMQDCCDRATEIRRIDDEIIDVLISTRLPVNSKIISGSAAIRGGGISIKREYITAPLDEMDGDARVLHPLFNGIEGTILCWLVFCFVCFSLSIVRVINFCCFLVS